MGWPGRAPAPGQAFLVRGTKRFFAYEVARAKSITTLQPFDVARRQAQRDGARHPTHTQ
jgi:hypothetical protein